MNQNQQKEEIQKLNNFRNEIIKYTDIVIRSLIAFIFVGILGSIILIGLFHIKIWLLFPIMFFLSIIISPLLSKIRLGEQLFNKYDEWLKGKNRICQ